MNDNDRFNKDFGSLVEAFTFIGAFSRTVVQIDEAIVQNVLDRGYGRSTTEDGVRYTTLKLMEEVLEYGLSALDFPEGEQEIIDAARVLIKRLFTNEAAPPARPSVESADEIADVYVSLAFAFYYLKDWLEAHYVSPQSATHRNGIQWMAFMKSRLDVQRGKTKGES